MSEPGSVFGAIICEDVYPTDRAAARYGMNLRAVQSLAAECRANEKPLLICRSMFAVPPPSGLPFYRKQVIHFGASYNHLDVIWPDWLRQFEVLLSSMTWEEAIVFADMDLVFKGEYRWTAVEPCFQAAPIVRWKFSGGPREF